MTNVIYAKPFTQIVEDAMLEVREANFADLNIRKKFRRRVNDVYQRRIPEEFVYWDFMKKTGNLSLTAALSTGTVTVTLNSPTVTYSTGGMTTNAYQNMWFTVPSTNEVYQILSNTATTFTISPSYIGASGSSLSFRVFQSIYTLASDYAYLTTEPGFWYHITGGKQYIEWAGDHLWAQRWTTIPSLRPYTIREYPDKTTSGLYQVEIMPPLTQTQILWYEYFRELPELQEFYGTGTATTSANSTTVTTSSDYSAYLSAGQYFRIDSDSTWIPIASVSGTTITLSSGYPTANTAKAFTVSDIPDIPTGLHLALFWGACMVTAIDQSDANGGATYAAEYKGSIANYLSKQNKKRYGRKTLRFKSHHYRKDTKG